MQTRMSPARIESILKSVKRVREGRSLTVKQFQKLLGLMSAASNVIPFGLLYMRPLQWWLLTKGFSPRGNTLCMIKVTRRCLCALDMWRKPLVLVSGPGNGSSLSPRNASDGGISHRVPAVCGVVAISHGTSTAWRCWPCFEHFKHFLPDLRDRHVLV